MYYGETIKGMNKNTSNALTEGEKLIKGIRNIKRRIHVKSATGFSKKEESVLDIMADSYADSLPELVMEGIFAVGLSCVSSIARKSNEKTDQKEEALIHQCENYRNILQSLSVELQQNLKQEKLRKYLKNDMDVNTYQGGFVKELFIDKEEEMKAILLEELIEEITWNNEFLQRQNNETIAVKG